MQKFSWFLAFTFFSFTVFAQPRHQDPETYTTHDSSGKPLAVFVRAMGPGSFGAGWMDPSKVIWSKYQGDYANESLAPDVNGVIVSSAATKACEAVGGILPTAETYYNLASYFELDESQRLTAQGLKDWYALFPDMKGHWFWSSTADPNEVYGKYDADEFDGDSFMFDYDIRPMHLAVRCTSQL